MKEIFTSAMGDFVNKAKKTVDSAQTHIDPFVAKITETAVSTRDTLETVANKSVDIIDSSIDKLEVKQLAEKAVELTESTKAEISKITESATKRFQSSNKKPSQGSEEEIERAIEKLKSRDKVGLTGEGLAAVGGGAAGVAAAGSIASAAGVTTLLGSSSLASALGGVLVTTTPVGWVVGSAVVAGAAGYGIAKLVRSGTKQDQVREQLVKKFEARLAAMRASQEKDSPIDQINQILPILITKQLISEVQAERMVSLIEKGNLNAHVALDRLTLLANKVVGESQE